MDCEHAIEWVQGDAVPVEVTAIDADTGEPVDITGGTPRLTIRPDLATAAVVTKTGTVTDGPGGVMEFAFATADTNTLAIDTYSYDVRVDQSGGDRITPIRPSPWKILQPVTQL